MEQERDYFKQERIRQRIIMNQKDQSTRAWLRGYRWARAHGYETIRDCRVVAMAYEMGWMNGRKSKKRS